VPREAALAIGRPPVWGRSAASGAAKARAEVTAEWRKIHNEGLQDLCTSNIVRVIKLRGMR